MRFSWSTSMCRAATLGAGILAAAVVTGWPGKVTAGPTRPFPRHVSLAAGTITPNNVAQSALDDKVKQFYGAWKQAFLRQGCGAGRYYVYLGPQSDTGSGVPISVSEGQGYGMMITAVIAGYDPAAQKIFNGLYQFYRDHPSQHDPLLMAWRQLSNCQSSSDQNSATDGDLSIAYALLLADKQWGSADAINYRAQALALLDAIRRNEINPETNLPQLGDWVSPDLPREYNAVRSSDLMLKHFRVFRAATGDPAWQATLDASFALIERMQSTYAPQTGLLPDFIEDTTSTPRPASPGFNYNGQAGNYDYNACRDPWAFSITAILNNDTRAEAIVSKPEDWILSSTGGDIYKLYAGYDLDGTPTVGYNNVCFTGAFGIGAMIDARYQTWLNRIWDDVAVTYVDTPSDYYGATLRLLYMLVMSDNWWPPF